uniref:N utilization substance protein B n=1 Tax=Anthurium amnicola TaxID=1678845 RepID=A0A1D1Y9Y4_9ARAE
MLLPASAAAGHRRRHFSLFFFFFSEKWMAKKGTSLLPSSPFLTAARSFRSEAALDALRGAAAHGVSPPSGGGDDDVGGRPQEEGDGEGSPSASDDGGNASGGYSLVLYNYPSFTGAMAALFANIYHSACKLPALILPFSSVEPFRVEDLKLRGLDKCYLLDFVGPDRFAVELSRFVPNVVAFDHRKSTLARVSQFGCFPQNLDLHIDTQKTSARAVYHYFSEKLSEKSPLEGHVSLLSQEDEHRIETILKYVEDADLRRWDLSDTKAFNIGLREERVKLNCVTNPYVFEQLLDIDPSDLISKGNSHISSRQDAAKKLLGKEFKIRLGRGFYGECLCIRADGHSNLSHEIGDELSKRSAAAGMRPIGAVVFIQRGNLKMCLRTTDNATDTSVVAKTYGGGGKSSSSSFIIRMDEYNHWTIANSL